MQVIRAGQTSRAAARASRVIQIIRLIRLLRIIKLYKLKDKAQQQKLIQDVQDDRLIEELKRRATKDFAQTSQKTNILQDESFNKKNQSFTKLILNQQLTMAVGNCKMEGMEIPEESRLGKRLSEITTKRVILLVLTLLLCIHFFNYETYKDPNTSYVYGLKVIDYFIQQKDLANLKKSYQSYIDLHKNDRIPLVYIELDNIYAADTDYEDLRDNEYKVVYLTSDKDYYFNSLAIFDLRSDIKLQALLNSLRILVVCLILSAASIVFSQHTNQLLVEPIENMNQKLKEISRNPLKAAQREEEEIYHKQMMQKGEKIKDSKRKGISETEYLEKMIIKIGALLALGFGEAGSEIIAKNITSDGEKVDPMISGKKTIAIYGFCDIRNFTDATEVLQEGIMLFVNEIADIVHSFVELFSGNANKNIGDAFLLV